jgi:hypothetical protein
MINGRGNSSGQITILRPVQGLAWCSFECLVTCACINVPEIGEVKFQCVDWKCGVLVTGKAMQPNSSDTTSVRQPPTGCNLYGVDSALPNGDIRPKPTGALIFYSLILLFTGSKSPISVPKGKLDIILGPPSLALSVLGLLTFFWVHML